jgi:hypothetical protein
LAFLALQDFPLRLGAGRRILYSRVARVVKKDGDVCAVP